VTLTFDLWPWTFACDVKKLCTTFESNQAIRGEIIAILEFDVMALNIALRFALGSDIIFHQVWPLTSYLCLNYSIFWCWSVMSRCDLWPVDREMLWYIKRHVIKLCTKLERNRAIPGWINFANFSHTLCHDTTTTTTTTATAAAAAAAATTTTTTTTSHSLQEHTVWWMCCCCCYYYY